MKQVHEDVKYVSSVSGGCEGWLWGCEYSGGGVAVVAVLSALLLHLLLARLPRCFTTGETNLLMSNA